MPPFPIEHLPRLPRDKSIGIGCIGSGFIMADCHLVAYRKAGFNPVAIAARNWLARTDFPWRPWPRRRFELRVCSFAGTIQGRDRFFTAVPSACHSDVTPIGHG